ncbi:hypothetical protein PROFUN_05577 [Planoprotostelium fungivorum]|uniref:TBC1 domain family member 24 n=1 Tax=Planoprotostelium fungivorum TaxID=1890364 RepID=A0A2P6N050_9EUKA|nr:hypothetical protein PROFUN_05577 [Planoprotostelium fungivorum]
MVYRYLASNWRLILNRLEPPRPLTQIFHIQSRSVQKSTDRSKMATSQDIPAENMQDWVEIPTLTITEAPENLSQSNPSTARTSRRQTISFTGRAPQPPSPRQSALAPQSNKTSRHRRSPSEGSKDLTTAPPAVTEPNNPYAIPPRRKFSVLEAFTFVRLPPAISKREQTRSVEQSADRIQKWSHVEFHEARIEERVPLCTSFYTSLKWLIKMGIPDPFRRVSWRILTGCAEFSHENPNFYMRALHNTFGEEVPKDILNVPTFGGKLSDTLLLVVGPERIKIMKRVLCVIAMEHPGLSYAPYLPNMVVLLSQHLSEGDTYVSIYLLLGLFPAVETKGRGREKKNYPHPHLKYTPQHKRIPTGYNDINAMFSTMCALAETKISGMRQLCEKLHISTMDFCKKIFFDYFVDLCSHPVVLDVFDCFLAEDVFFTYKVSLAFLKTLMTDFSARIQCCQNESDFLTAARDMGMTMNDGCYLVDLAATFKVDRNKVYGKDRNKSIDQALKHMTLFYHPKGLGKSEIIDSMQFEMIYTWLTARLRITNPILVYQSSKQGYSTSSLRNQCTETPQLIVLKTNKGIMGAFVMENWKGKGTRWYGDRHTFLFRFDPTPQKYNWTEGNLEAFQCNDGNGIQIGGPEGGLCLDEEMYRGHSRRSASLNNDPLTCDGSEDFTCSAVEVYNFE